MKQQNHDTITDLRRRVSEELLPLVERPGQYIGGEINQIRHTNPDLTVALVFPDTYTIGMSHLGSQILYHVLNAMPGVSVERVFAPWFDAEAVMRKQNIPLFSWESRKPVREFHIVGFSLQHEMCYTTVLNLLDLAGIPIHSDKRRRQDPLVIAGGPCADSPEPIAPFIDAFVIGDGEETAPALVEAVRTLRAGKIGRKEMLLELARRFDWLYVPCFYQPEYYRDGTLSALAPTQSGVPETIRHAFIPDLEHAPFPTAPVIPHTQAVHERINLEIMRGCPHACRFCHAGAVKKPVRRRSPDKLLELAEDCYRNTGYDEIALASLSTSDYPELVELMQRLNERFADRHVGLAVPSLRIGEQLKVIPHLASRVRKSGLTVAVEAARPEMRKAIGKNITNEELFAGLESVYKAGFRSVKLYFMAGFPGETEADIDAIHDLARQVSRLRREMAGQPANVNATVSWFVPKPHTPLQWVAQASPDYFRLVREHLLSLRGRRRSINYRFHAIERSAIEAILARGDRRLARAIEFAWRRGARLEGWDEGFEYSRWPEALAAAGLDEKFYAHRERPLDERLAWDHILAGPPRERLEKEYARFTQLSRGQ